MSLMVTKVTIINSPITNYAITRIKIVIGELIMQINNNAQIIIIEITKANIKSAIKSIKIIT